MCVCAPVRECVCVSVCVCVCEHVCVRLHQCVWEFVSLCVFVCVCASVCAFINSVCENVFGFCLFLRCVSCRDDDLPVSTACENVDKSDALNPLTVVSQTVSEFSYRLVVHIYFDVTVN